MITPYLKDQALLDNIKMVKKDQYRFYMWWRGQSGFLIYWKGQYLLMDPYLSDSLTHKYALTEKQHIRMTELVVQPSRLDFINVVTSSHNHTDHLDAETLRPLMKANPQMQLIIPEANRDFVSQRLQCDREYPIGLNDGENVSLGHFKFHGIPAAHNYLDKNSKGQCLYMGYIVEFGPWKYIS